MDCTGQITIEDVRIPAGDGVLLAGTRCHPRAARAVALLLPGSGPQDRDQTVAGQPTFRHLAAGLADRGIGTLRCDDRGVGASGGDYLLLDGATLLADARAQVRWLRDRAADVPVAVIGHSQGGLFALRLAGVEPVCSTVLLGAAIRPGFESLMAMRARLADQAGASGPTRDAYLEHSKVLFTALVSIADWIRLAIQRAPSGR